MSDESRIGQCGHCNEENQKLEYSDLYDEWMCKSCWEYTAELYLSTGDMHYFI